METKNKVMLYALQAAEKEERQEAKKDNSLFQSFCLINQMGRIKVPSKTTLQRYTQMIPETVIREIVQDVTRVASTAPSEGEKQRLKLQEAISLDDMYYDTTCV